MYKINEESYKCPIESVASILGKKWVGEIIWGIQDNKVRFGKLQRKLKSCSKKMLVQQLDLLIKNEIIIKEKKSINNIIESTYYLSETGMLLLPIMNKMIEWGNNNLLCNE